MSHKCVVSFPDATSTQSWHVLQRLYYILNPWFPSNHLFWGCCMYTSWTSHSHGSIECKLIAVFPRCSTLIGALFSSICGTGSCTSLTPRLGFTFFLPSRGYHPDTFQELNLRTHQDWISQFDTILFDFGTVSKLSRICSHYFRLELDLAAPNLHLSGFELGPEVVEMKRGKTFVQFFCGFACRGCLDCKSIGKIRWLQWLGMEGSKM